ncbi:VOC family protein [Pedobacter nototheniae]|uniref:VOC family protein n=1 Tax=Pedobacter nototheniae TaxID=2488994 RepID=UPI002931AB29|nr:VOC family protein [Pedobacter nototheniae]
MATKIFVNLPVKDLNKSVEFFTKLGYTFNAQFTDEKATCMIISEENFVMLIVESFFKTFIKKEICDTTKSTEALISLSAESKNEVQEIVKKAMDAGASKNVDAQDLGFMYEESFQDLDGHIWSYFYMDMSAMPQG